MNEVSSNPFATWRPQTNDTLDLRLVGKKTDFFIPKIIDMKEKLKQLITQASYLNKIHYKALSEQCPNLEVLNLHCANRTADAALGYFVTFKKLRELNLSRVTYNRIPMLHITDDGIIPLLTACTQLKILDLSFSRITDATLNIIAGKENIRQLKIEGCTQITKNGLEQLTLKRKNLTILQKDDATNASLSFQALAKGVKNRYLSDFPWIKSDSKQPYYLNPNISKEEFELISPELLCLADTPEEQATLFETLSIKDS